MDSDISSSKPFQFRQFSISHHNSTMKVGTDAILLADWCDVDNAEYILDVGTGSGVIALLMAARSKARVDAVELDHQSVTEAGINFNNSSYSKQLNIYHDDFNKFAENTKQKYDIIISNPPFFSGNLLPEDSSRKAARHIDNLSHNMLCDGVVKLLTKNGRFCLVLPENQSCKFIKTANNHNLYLSKQQVIFPKPKTKPNRKNMEFRFNKGSIVNTEDIVIRDENGKHTDQYKEYVSDFLMKI